MRSRVIHYLAGVLIVAVILSAPVLFSSRSAGALKYGDVNNDGKINVHDVVLVMRHILGFDSLGFINAQLADVNGDGAVNVQDTVLLMQKSLGLIDTFPVMDVEIDLVKEFIVEDEGLLPGKSMVIVILAVENPGDYTVKIGAALLEYRDSVGGFRGEVYKDEAKRENIVVERID